MRLRRGWGDNNISIHAPPRGATANQGCEERGSGISIHAPPRGATTLPAAICPAASYFNSRPSARGDKVTMTTKPRNRVLFQFTPLREGRQKGWGKKRAYSISIHAPPRGATAKDAQAEKGRKISIHAPPRGATFEQMANAIPYIISIHAPPRGATAAIFSPPSKAPLFQFTPLREGRRHGQGLYRADYDFNSRPSARGDRHDAHRRGLVGTISIHAPPRGATHRGSECFRA